MSWIAFIIEGLARAFKVIFGMNSPAKVTVINEKSPLPPKPDNVLLDELGVRHGRAESGNTDSADETRPAGENR